MLHKYRYHFGIVKMLSKNAYIESRKISLLGAPHDIMTIRYYSDHLATQFNK